MPEQDYLSPLTNMSEKLTLYLNIFCDVIL